MLENMAQVGNMAKTSMPTPPRMSTRIARNPHVDEKAVECIILDVRLHYLTYI